MKWLWVFQCLKVSCRLFSGLALLMATMGASSLDQSTIYSDQFLAYQAKALQPAFRADIERLAQAPRYTLAASADPVSGRVQGDLSVRYINKDDEPVGELIFRLYPNVPAIYGPSTLTIQEVIQDGNPLELQFADNNTTLRVRLAEPLPPQEAVEVAIRFTTQVASLEAQVEQGYGILAVSPNILSLSGWYPMLAIYNEGWQTPPLPSVGDVLQAETSFYEVTLTVPAGYHIVASGVVTAQEEVGEQSVYHLASGPARDFSAVISPSLTAHEATAAGVTVRFHALPSSYRPINTPPQVLQMISHAVVAFSESLGPFPLTEIDVVETGVMIGGYEFSGLVVVDHQQRVYSTFANYRYLVYHELAHQWWYNLIGNEVVAEPWLDEAFATYSAALAWEHADGTAAGTNLVAYWQRRYGLPTAQDPPVNSATTMFDSWAFYRRNVYFHGALFLHQLRQELGDDTFIQLLQQYQETYRYQLVTSADFFNMAAEAAGDRDLSPLLSQWFNPTNQP